MPDLIRVLQSTQDSFLAEAAAEALGKIGDPMALPALKNAARLGTVRVRNASAQAVECIRAQERMQLLPEKKS